MHKNVRAVLLLVALCIGVAIWVFKKSPLLPTEVPKGVSMYQSVGQYKTNISIVSDQLPNITQIEITPDGNTMFIGTLPGKIFVYQKKDGVFRRQNKLFFDLPTAQPGWPPQEAGLTGMALAADFEKSGDIFLMHSFAKEKRSFRNRVTRVTMEKQGENLVGGSPKQIFEANAAGTGSHQIQDGVGVVVDGKPYIVFGIGEGFQSKRALDVSQEAGKIMMMDRDGGAPEGKRPYPDAPRIQAIGIRNPPAIALNPDNGFIAMGDTGPNNYDRFIYGRLLDASGTSAFPFSFNWDGSEASLQKPALNPYDGNKDAVLHRWVPTETAVNIVFYEHSKLKDLPEGKQYALVTLFGRTGEKKNTPGKSIMLSTITHGTKNTVSFEPFIARSPEGEGKMGHPLGLATDPTNGDIYFGDIIDGRLYKAVLQ